MNPETGLPPDEVASEVLPQPSASRRRTVVLAAVLLSGVILCWVGQRKIARTIDHRVSSALATRGWTLQHQDVSWGPSHGLRMEQVKLGRSGQAPMLELRSVDVELPWSAFFGKTPDSVTLKSKRTPMILRDAAGELRFQRVSIEIAAGKDEVVVRDFSALKDGLGVILNGKILVAGNPASGMEGWQPDFGGVRSALSTLKMESGKGQFNVSGSFEVDARAGAYRKWSAKLDGKGKAMSWHGVPLTAAKVEAQLTESASTIHSTLSLTKGELAFKVERGKWETMPFSFTGSLTDERNRRDEFEGAYDPADGSWLLKRLRGPADLWSLAREVPRFAEHLPDPDQITVETFPTIDLRRASVAKGEAWKVESVLLTSEAELTAKIDGKPVKITDVRGNASLEDGAWAIHRCVGHLLGGEGSVSGVYRDAQFRKATLTAKNLRLAAVKEAAGEEGKSKGILSFSYRGDMNFKTRHLDGRGTMTLENAPVIEVPLLDQTQRLFASMIPGIDERSGTGRFDASFIGNKRVIEVPRFEASGGSLTVSAKGKVDLEERRVDGVARGKLTGLPGLVTKPLSRLLEMEVGGPFDDIRVKPLGPAKLASSTVSGLVGVPVETLEEVGKVTGSVIVEGVKMSVRWLGGEVD